MLLALDRGQAGREDILSARFHVRRIQLLLLLFIALPFVYWFLIPRCKRPRMLCSAIQPVYPIHPDLLRRYPCLHGTQEVSHDLQELKHSAAHVHAQLAETPPPAEVQPSPPRPRRSRSTPPSRSTDRSGMPLEEQCRFAQLEERQLREEVETLNSRVGWWGGAGGVEGRASMVMRAGG